MDKEPSLKIPIDVVAQNAKSELKTALDTFYAEHEGELQPNERKFLLPFGKQKKEKRKNVLDRAVHNLEFVNYLIQECPSVVEVIERSKVKINLVPEPNIYPNRLYGFFVLRQNGLSINTGDSNLLTPSTLQELYDTGEFSKYMNKFADYDGKQIVDRIINELKTK